MTMMSNELAVILKLTEIIKEQEQIINLLRNKLNPNIQENN